MYNNYDYPAGADTPDAPWNEMENPEKAFEVYASQTLSRNSTIMTKDYHLSVSKEYDDDGHPFAVTELDTSETDWKSAYTDCSMTPMSIIDTAKELAQYLREEGVEKVKGINLSDFIAECTGWIEDDFEVCEN